jgi:fatty-acyl-CoA synthase
MATWLGITRMGGVVALLNTNLRGHALAHCINIVEPKHIIVAADFADEFASARPHLATNARVWSHGQSGEFPRIDRELENLSASPPSAADRPPLTIEDHALFIYSSGTTGLPKAANINHYRLMLATHGFAGAMNAQASDRMYNSLPMYHTTGGVVAPGALLLKGGATVIRERFSAHAFWDDVVRWDCTLFQYIGELCRYLVHTPESPSEKKHRIRLACGNGLRPDVWPDFQARFRIPQILEFYAATEGNVALFNFEGKVGAVGRIPWFVAHRFPTAVVKFDIETERPVRNAEGFCIRCEPDEAGEVIGQILNDPSKPANRFEGYASKSETEKKILHDVFEKGDAWFRTGDLMKKDKNGYFYFIDRIGDTYRWKGENVATSQVSEAISAFPGIHDANIYGVSIPGTEGRAGMAALVVDGELDMTAFRAYLLKQLPDYARPLFVRIRSERDVTGTFKQKKVDLVREGFDPERIGDPIYFNDVQNHAFVPLNKPLYERIVAGQVRL